MTYNVGDPNHIGVHNVLRTQLLAEGVPPDLLPTEAHLGDTGHVEDHNAIVDALAWLAINGGPGKPVATGGEISTITENGKTYTVHVFRSSAAIDVTRAGVARVLVVAGGASGTHGSQWPAGGGGGGGGVVEQTIVLPVGLIPITVGGSDADSGIGAACSPEAVWAKGGAGGAGGTHNNGNPYGYVGNWPPQAYAPAQYGGGGGAGGPGSGNAGGPGRASDITGTPVLYGAGGVTGRGGEPGEAGAPNTGNGGEGGRGGNTGTPRTPGAGGSGIVIVRYQS